ncbi:hypothetical protein [Gelidibacter maritimus]|uniref:Uncharacterized protein n=1 Tax=Gelidibacter maritimus TaxID=2761487 RepID=A0A7W2M4K1_9FLAO|nr:hypothetical protein [Gelidibacter maritimus]MBA6152599.1 hypothetical protein [Gelidibacter maritimus]
MKNSFIILILISVLCFNCDKRQTKKEALEQSISEFNQKHRVLETVKYHPEAHVEIVTDTLIANTTNVHIKNYSLSDNQILILSSTNSNLGEVNYHRVFESEVVISKASKDIFRTHISAMQFKGNSTDQFWNNATLQHVWLNQELSTVDDIKLEMSFINPRNMAFKMYRISIDGYGQKSFKLIEERG